MKFYLYRMKGNTKEYFAGISLCSTYVTTEKDKAKVFNFKWDAEQKLIDLRTSKKKWYLEENPNP